MLKRHCLGLRERCNHSSHSVGHTIVPLLTSRGVRAWSDESFRRACVRKGRQDIRWRVVEVAVCGRIGARGSSRRGHAYLLLNKLSCNNYRNVSLMERSHSRRVSPASINTYRLSSLLLPRHAVVEWVDKKRTREIELCEVTRSAESHC